MSSSNLAEFREQFVTQAKSRLLAVDVAASTDTDLIVHSALLRALDAVNQFDPITPESVAFLAGMTGAELQTYLNDPSNRQSFEQVLASATAMTAVAASATAMTAVAASSTAMSTALNATVARNAFWSSATALSAIQSAPSSVLDSLQSHARTSLMSNNPSNLTSAFISGKSITLRVRNTSASDTNYMRALAGGSGSGDDVFSTSTSWQNRVRAYQDIRHYQWASNYTFQAYVLNMN